MREHEDGCRLHDGTVLRILLRTQCSCGVCCAFVRETCSAAAAEYLSPAAGASLSSERIASDEPYWITMSRLRGRRR